MESLAKPVGLSVDSSLSSCALNYGALSEDTKQEVLDFYNNNDITWQAPGLKDRVIIREIGTDAVKVKRTKQVRYMLMSLKEAHSKFGESHANTKIGLAKFCELRPKNVKLFDLIPHHVCVCSYHENIHLLLVPLSKHTSLTVNFRGFINQITCDSSKKECMGSQCRDCAHLIESYAPSNAADTVRYQQWQHNDKTEKVDIIGTMNDVFGELKRHLRDFLIHTC